ncbi:hypothetical protein S83_013258 [Arachis hypogaea]
MSNDGDGLGLDEAPFEEVLADGFDSGFGHKEAFMACCGFAESATQNCEDFLQMLILRKEIPAWFEYQEEDDGVSVSFLKNCPSIETIALALCFLIEIEEYIDPVQLLVIYNGEKFINASLFVGPLVQIICSLSA